MSRPEPSPTQRLSARLTQLEELMMHFQRTLEDLDQVAQHLQRRMDTLEAGLRRLSVQVGGLAEDGEEERTLDDERPPHY